MVLLQPDPFLNELTSMFERSTEKGSVWATLKRSSLKSKVQRNKMKTAREPLGYRCLIRASNGKKTISTSNGLGGLSEATTNGKSDEKQSGEHSIVNVLLAQVGAKDHQQFQASYATILKAHMTALKKRERKDKKKAAADATNKKDGESSKKRPKKV